MKFLIKKRKYRRVASLFSSYALIRGSFWSCVYQNHGKRVEVPPSGLPNGWTWWVKSFRSPDRPNSIICIRKSAVVNNLIRIYKSYKLHWQRGESCQVTLISASFVYCDFNISYKTRQHPAMSFYLFVLDSECILKI